MSAGLIVTGIFAIFGISLIIRGVLVVRQNECVIVERLGKYHAVLRSGLNFIIPFLDTPRTIYWMQNGVVSIKTRIDLRETVMDVAEQSVITRDNVSIVIDALLYLQITDPVKAAYEISNLPVAVGQLAQTSLRNVVGEMDLDETLVSRDKVNMRLKTILDEATDKWGTKVNRVEIRNITPPRDIQSAMEKQMQAERERRAQVLQAEGDKQARIARSQGEQQEKINLADGDREARIREAEGEASAIEAVAKANQAAIERIRSALGNDSQLTVQYLLASRYLEQFGNFVTQKGDKIFIPYEASTSLGAIGSIREILSNTPQK